MTSPDPGDAFLRRFSRALLGDARWKSETLDEIEEHVRRLIEALPADDRSVSTLVKRLGHPTRLAVRLSGERAIELVGARAGRIAKIFFVAGVAALAVVGAIDITRRPSSDPALGREALSSGVADLADAVRRWTAEAPTTGPGEPLTDQATSLYTSADTNDTLRAFPTSRGRICFEVLGAGTCGTVDPTNPVTLAILYTKDAGTRLFGVASDTVTRVQVDLHSTVHDATLQQNGFYYHLPPAYTSDDIRNVISTTSDGQTHTFPVHPA